jgi:hypothetical protein
MNSAVWACETNPLTLEQLFPVSTSSSVLDTCMQVCSDLVHLDFLKEKPSLFWMDALLGKMVRLQAGIERLAQVAELPSLHADDLIYLLAMITRVDVAAESLAIDSEHQALYHALLRTIKTGLAHLLTQVHAGQTSI